MAVVTAEIRFAPKLTAWFTANPTLVLQDGEIVYCSDGANIGKYVIGDNSTALSALTFYGGVSASGLTVGTTTITSGTNTRILYNNSGVVGEYTLTGTGTVVAMGTSPVFTTDITTPLIIGGTAVGSTIQYKGTSGVGTSTIAAHQFLVGSNGGTTAFNVYNSGQVLFNGSTLPGGTLSQVRITKGTGIVDIGEWASGRGGIWFNLATPTVSNFHVGANASGTDGYLNGSAASRLLANGSIIVSAFPTQVTFNPSAATGSTVNFDFTSPANTSRTALTNVPNFKVTGSTSVWNPGTVPLQYFNWFSQNTTSTTSATNFTVVANLVADYVNGAGSATNVTSAAIYVPTLALTNTGTGIGLLVNAPTGGTSSNLTAKFQGGSTVTSGAVLATTATDGFLYLPSCAGLPTGVPTAQTGTIPIVIDSTNNKAYIYSGGAWVALN